MDIVLKNVGRWRGNRCSAVQSFMRHVGSDGLTHKTEKSLSRESSLAIHGLFDPGLESVADETGYQLLQRNMLLLCEFAKMAQEIIGQHNEDVRIRVHYDPPSAFSRRRPGVSQRMDKVRSVPSVQLKVDRGSHHRGWHCSPMNPNQRANRTCR